MVGIGGFARAPLPRRSDEEAEGWSEGLRWLVALEKGLRRTSEGNRGLEVSI